MGYRSALSNAGTFCQTVAMPSSPDPDRRYHVVMNHEEQYSIWPAGRDLPGGWTNAGFEGSKEECLAHIEKVWTDMTPLSLRSAKPDA